MQFDIGKYYENEEDLIYDLIHDFEIDDNKELSEMQEECYNIFEKRTQVFYKNNLVLETLNYNNKQYYFLEDLETEIMYKIVVGV